MSPEQRVLQEVLDTENVYVTDLKQVVEVRLFIVLYTSTSSKSRILIFYDLTFFFYISNSSL